MKMNSFSLKMNDGCEIFLNKNPIMAPMTVAPPTPKAVSNTSCISAPLIVLCFNPYS